MRRFTVLGMIIPLFIISLIAGCGHPLETGVIGVQFKNEAQLEKEGFITNLDQEVNIGDEKILIQKIAFDRNSMAFAYKGGTVPLLAAEFQIKGLERTKPQKIINVDSTASFGAMIGNGYRVVVVPHNLKLVNQKVIVEFNINGRDSKFTINFPGDIINSSTTEMMVDSNGNPVNEATRAMYRVVVGVGYTSVESKSDNDLIVETQEQQKLRLSYKGSTTGESFTVYEPLPLPRREPSIKVDQAIKIAVISVK